MPAMARGGQCSATAAATATAPAQPASAWVHTTAVLVHGAVWLCQDPQLTLSGSMQHHQHHCLAPRHMALLVL